MTGKAQPPAQKFGGMAPLNLFSHSAAALFLPHSSENPSTATLDFGGGGGEGGTFESEKRPPLPCTSLLSFSPPCLCSLLISGAQKLEREKRFSRIARERKRGWVIIFLLFPSSRGRHEKCPDGISFPPIPPKPGEKNKGWWKEGEPLCVNFKDTNRRFFAPSLPCYRHATAFYCGGEKNLSS